MMLKISFYRLFGVFALLAGCAGRCLAAPAEVGAFIEKNCAECHDPDLQKGDLDLTSLKFDLDDPKNFARWVLVHDRVSAGEMPPKKKARPAPAELAKFTASLTDALTAADNARAAREGRATQRRLNRYEYENALRDLLHAPWLQLRDSLPEDGEASRFNKIGDALDVSHVQMARYMSVADTALRQVAATDSEHLSATTVRYYARDQRSFTGKMKFSVFNTRPERATFAVLGTKGQPDVRMGKAPMTVGDADPKTREQEAVGVVASSYEPIEVSFNRFRAPASGRYKLRFKTYSVWAGPGKGNKWFIPDLDNISPGRRPEPVTIYSETPPRLLRLLGSFDAQTKPGVAEIDTYLLEGETIRPDAARLFRSRPPSWINPLAEKDGCPGVAFAWMEVEGPVGGADPAAGEKLLFGDLPVKKAASAGPGRFGNRESATRGAGRQSAAMPDVISKNPRQDAERLLRNFLAQAYREPTGAADVARFLKVFDAASASGSGFADAMIASYTAVLCSPRFVCLEEKPGRLDDFALASRMSFFLWNSPPDEELRSLAAAGKLHEPAVLKAQTDRLLNDAKSRRFVNAFLDYWLDLRKINNTSADEVLYNDYYLDDLLVESALGETQLFFNDLVKGNLPARNLVSSDFSMLNERLATHYGIPGVDGVALRRVKLPAGSVRGGLLTQASVLKVTANGTTTSPVIRGAWIMERILGKPPRPKPASVPAIEPDTRGATTIREQLARHRSEASCAACHAKMDPPGFALENFDVLGGWRDHYRALDKGATPVKGIGKNGQRFVFHEGQPVDASGELPTGEKFQDVRGLKALLLQDQRQIARNLTRQLLIYATGAPVRFGDRASVEKILDRTAANQFGVRSLIHEIVESELFLEK
jgi:mono/diheme cytochrome c family protein